MIRILVVDDSKSVHAFLKACVENYDVQLTHVYNGEEAVKFATVNANASGIDLILLDWEMPILDGPSTFDRLRQIGIQTPVVMMTTKNAIENVELMVSKGVSDYMFKPFTGDILKSKLEMLFGELVTRDVA